MYDLKTIKKALKLLKQYDYKLEYQISNNIYKQFSNDLNSEFITATIKLCNNKDIGIVVYNYSSNPVSENDKYYSENKELRKMIGNKVTILISNNIDINILKIIIQQLGGGYITYDKDGDRIIENINELNGKVIAECILQTADERNRNGRYYAKDLNILFSEEKEKNTNENSNSKN